MELIAEVAPAFLRNHWFRSYYFAVALADRDNLRFDGELLYIAACSTTPR